MKAILIRCDDVIDVEQMASEIDRDPRLTVDVIGWPPDPLEVERLLDTTTEGERPHGYR